MPATVLQQSFHCAFVDPVAGYTLCEILCQPRKRPRNVGGNPAALASNAVGRAEGKITTVTANKEHSRRQLEHAVPGILRQDQVDVTLLHARLGGTDNNVPTLLKLLYCQLLWGLVLTKDPQRVSLETAVQKPTPTGRTECSVLNCKHEADLSHAVTSTNQFLKVRDNASRSAFLFFRSSCTPTVPLVKIVKFHKRRNSSTCAYDQPQTNTSHNVRKAMEGGGNTTTHAIPQMSSSKSLLESNRG
jgi:hypothetical protein